MKRARWVEFNRRELWGVMGVGRRQVGWIDSGRVEIGGPLRWAAEWRLLRAPCPTSIAVLLELNFPSSLNLRRSQSFSPSVTSLFCRLLALSTPSSPAHDLTPFVYTPASCSSRAAVSCFSSPSTKLVSGSGFLFFCPSWSLALLFSFTVQYWMCSLILYLMVGLGNTRWESCARHQAKQTPCTPSYR